MDWVAPPPWNIQLIEEIDKLLKKVEKRVREPIGFWETIIGAFGDMFR